MKENGCKFIKTSTKSLGGTRVQEGGKIVATWTQKELRTARNGRKRARMAGNVAGTEPKKKEKKKKKKETNEEKRRRKREQKKKKGTYLVVVEDIPDHLGVLRTGHRACRGIAGTDQSQHSHRKVTAQSQHGYSTVRVTARSQHDHSTSTEGKGWACHGIACVSREGSVWVGEGGRGAVSGRGREKGRRWGGKKGCNKWKRQASIGFRSDCSRQSERMR